MASYRDAWYQEFLEFLEFLELPTGWTLQSPREKGRLSEFSSAAGRPVSIRRLGPRVSGVARERRSSSRPRRLLPAWRHADQDPYEEFIWARKACMAPPQEDASTRAPARNHGRGSCGGDALWPGRYPRPGCHDAADGHQRPEPLVRRLSGRRFAGSASERRHVDRDACHPG